MTQCPHRAETMLTYRDRDTDTDGDETETKTERETYTHTERESLRGKTNLSRVTRNKSVTSRHRHQLTTAFTCFSRRKEGAVSGSAIQDLYSNPNTSPMASPKGTEIAISFKPQFRNMNVRRLGSLRCTSKARQIRTSRRLACLMKGRPCNDTIAMV
jgi:hypothetical protein